MATRWTPWWKRLDGDIGIADAVGFPAFFYNSPANHYSETLDVFRQLDLTNFSDILERAAGLLFIEGVPLRVQDRCAVIDQLPEDTGTEKEFEELYRLHSGYGGGDHVLDVLEQWYARA